MLPESGIEDVNVANATAKVIVVAEVVGAVLALAALAAGALRDGRSGSSERVAAVAA